MKTLLSFSIVMIMVITASAAPQGLRAPVRGKKQARTEKPVPVTEREIQGVIPRAFRGGNPLQMLNPTAPAKYGTAEQSVVFNTDTGKCEGIKLFEILF